MLDDRPSGKPAATHSAIVVVGITALLTVTGSGLAWLWCVVDTDPTGRSGRESANNASIASFFLDSDNDAVQGYSTDDSREVPLESTGAAGPGLGSQRDGAAGTQHDAATDTLINPDATAGLVGVGARASLHGAVIPGDLKLVQLLLADGVDANDRKVAGAYPGETPLHTAAYAGHTDIAELLLAYGAEVNAVDGYSYTPLHRTVSEGHLAMAELLIENGADIVTKDAGGMSLLHAVARTNHVAMAELLINGGADINAMDGSNFTPLDYAQGGEAGMAEALKKSGGLCTIC